MDNTKIMVEREAYTSKKGKQQFAYFIKGNIRGVDFKAKVAPPDIGGYTVLEIVFNGASQAELVVTPFEFTDETSGEVRKVNTYKVVSTDADGTVYECKVAPTEKSDKDLFNMLFRG